MIVAVSVVVEAGVNVAGFGAEAVLEAGAGAAGAAGKGAEGIVFVVHRGSAIRSEVFADVTISIISGEVVGVAAADPASGEQSTYATCALHAAADVKAPREGILQCGLIVLRNAVPSIVGIAGIDGAACGAADQPREVIVAVAINGGAEGK